MKQFLVILGLMAAVWLGVSMAEEKVYPVRVPVVMTGYDTVRYAVVSADTVLPLQVRMSGLSAFLHSVRHGDTLFVAVPKGESAVAVKSLDAQLKRLILGSRQAASKIDSLRIVLVQRESRTYPVRIDDVDFAFSDQYGLYGEPTVTPSEVTLYGPSEVLASIGEVRVAAANLHGITASGTYRLPLEPVWKQYTDVRPSCTEVEVSLPVEAYVEREFTVPVSVVDADSTVTLRLYPETVTVRAWVAQCDLQRDPEFVVAVDYADVLHGAARLTPQLVEFPSYVRPRRVEPQEIQVVVIR